MQDNKVPCEVYSRIVGYLRPVQNWNDGKKQEFKDRLEYNEKVSIESAHGSKMALEIEAKQ